MVADAGQKWRARILKLGRLRYSILFAVFVAVGPLLLINAIDLWLTCYRHGFDEGKKVFFSEFDFPWASLIANPVFCFCLGYFYVWPNVMADDGKSRSDEQKESDSKL